ncbi:hypothetical protein A2962_04150 [Candidatus Woesebacteria bacterium RIFCSPLOWO2_01_FULL_39_61]|uniref:Inositol-1-monophosphatase n=1 Tax=Candidatus Woesebacteria bacterium RIFCSPHIGHO2_02_FULL_39_13 TaxID=1802505 RepID=A0A1F7Z0B1_9BACT|nr:MAG: hypothetical protein A2692_00505 [Candidatus Woesebacteria bacterium RIFCSPHIGHO2_01_FULL_39_95]OGM32155.1 MAG: hypothetical protein A3D01_02090 [Candidatus Woesebacteria bacterium RIFCSPHIGHO2_02_FULL_39_13]OGM36604.1 MAG: hypothetical protein A3E13_02925 [Candidatus Woesebacteria bacterium RIFCSPHIGHO2_12_FULL_40_20]OGM65945.1 MAG: hypothetical protein A2962_04150 [Candidatus Woesebacteria bacterium RIFCSPLOWO2_01_FULL_39_61]OGM71413.1 MAG: hypothetical protein A3H19_04580 [Candidatus
MIEVAKEAAIESGKITLSLQGKRHTFIGKEKLGDFTTEADITSEKKILSILQTKFPDHNFISEEIGKIDNGSDYWWIIDPLDGTIPYTSGLRTFGVSIGLLKDKKPILGVVNLPAMESLFWAEEGKGAFLNGQEVKVKANNDLSEAIVAFGLGHRQERQKMLNELVMPIADEVRYPPVVDCAVFGGSMVAAGIYDAFVHYAYPWDFAAAAVLTTEAGGKVTDLKGKPIDWFQPRIMYVASNGLLHDEILSLIE